MSQFKELQHLYVPFKDIEIATNNFQEVIGRGGYGWVYKGQLIISGIQTAVAVKRLYRNFGQGPKEFLTEIQLLAGQKHPNLISLVGYCDEGDERIIVYEYAERGSLDRYIRPRNNATHTLTWLERLKICLDAARGLKYLHNQVGNHQSVIHRDIKSANILIDENWDAKISDLGLSKLSMTGLNNGSSVISNACGTPGYCEPEYASSGIVKKESDIYSFGMVLFEVLCGRLVNVEEHDGFLLSAKVIKQYHEEGKLNEIVDLRLRNQITSDSLEKFLAIAYGCLLDEREQRPLVNDVVKELEELVNTFQVVSFRSLKRPEDDEFSLELSKQHNYDDVVERIARHLNVDDPSKIRLTSQNCYAHRPNLQPILYRGVAHLSDMLTNNNQTTDILYYEVLDTPLPELERLKTLKVSFHHAIKNDVVIHTIRLPKKSTVRDLINDLKMKVELSNKDAELRLFEVSLNKIYKIFPINEEIDNINDQDWTIRAEEVPEEEKDLGPHDLLIRVHHFMKGSALNQVQNFGEPFLFVIHEVETLAQVKLRIEKKLQVPHEEFSKWKFAFLSLGILTYLKDSDIVTNHFQRTEIYRTWFQYLGLEHSDNSPQSSHAARPGFMVDGTPNTTPSTKTRHTLTSGASSNNEVNILRKRIHLLEQKIIELKAREDASREEITMLGRLVNILREQIRQSEQQIIGLKAREEAAIAREEASRKETHDKIAMLEQLILSRIGPT